MKVHPIPQAILETTRSGSIQILHHCSVSWKITPLYFYRSNGTHFPQKEPITVKILRISSAQVKIQQILVILETINQFFFRTCHHCSVSGETNLWYFFSWNFIYFQQKEPIKVQILWNFSNRKSEIVHFDGFLLSKSYKVSAKKIQKNYFSWH